ncbi:hypothetical protein ATO00_03800 [Loigolactobacillus coryniformis subsp. coryniformis]|nr:hypothetical protein ATO00_03800 [Loigolactobacillus coryniformis subsp. coryniformis]
MIKFHCGTCFQNSSSSLNIAYEPNKNQLFIDSLYAKPAVTYNLNVWMNSQFLFRFYMNYTKIRKHVKIEVLFRKLFFNSLSIGDESA